jgi:hypothetical protein
MDVVGQQSTLPARNNKHGYLQLALFGTAIDTRAFNHATFLSQDEHWARRSLTLERELHCGSCFHLAEKKTWGFNERELVRGD